MEHPLISIIMPVFNTGSYLNEAIESVVQQQPIDDCAVPSLELIVVDDNSSDSETLDIINSAPRLDTRIRVLKNERKKGASGTRNTGILHARGAWIGFLDSDDMWLPNSLAERWRFILDNPEAKWIAAHHYLLKENLGLVDSPLSMRSPILYSNIREDYDAGRVSHLHRPVEMLTKNCFLTIFTVLLDRELLLAKGMFNEDLRRAEDYYLWFKFALDNDLWVLPFDVAIYRIHTSSLTHGDNPMYLEEDQMLELLLRDPAFEKYGDLLRQRLDVVIGANCNFYRSHKMYRDALHWSCEWVKKRPMVGAAWKQLLASALRF